MESLPEAGIFLNDLVMVPHTVVLGKGGRFCPFLGPPLSLPEGITEGCPDNPFPLPAQSPLAWWRHFSAPSPEQKQILLMAPGESSFQKSPSPGYCQALPPS